MDTKICEQKSQIWELYFLYSADRIKTRKELHVGGIKMKPDINSSNKLIGRKCGRFRINPRELQHYSMCAIPVILVFIFSYLPMGGLIIAFKDYKYNLGILGSKWVGLKNFEFMIYSNDFTRLVRNTLGLNFIFILTGTISALLLAILLFGLKSRTSTKIYQTVLITPHFLSWVVVSYMLYAFLHPSNGIVNNFLENVLHVAAVDWYATPSAWPLILTIASIWKHVGMDSVVYYAALMGIDASLFEAAKIDGATNRQINFKIIMPLLVPLITILTIMKIGNIFRADFGLFYQLTRDVGALYSTTDVIDTYIFRVMRKVGDMSMSTAVGFLQSIVGFILVLLTNAVAKKIDPSMSLF